MATGNLFSAAETLALPLNDVMNVPKGTFDYLFLFVSEFICRSLETGIMLDDDTGIGAIIPPKTKAMRLFAAFFSAQKQGYVSEVLDYAVENELTKILYFDRNFTEIELTELILMKRLLGCINASICDDIAIKMSGFNTLAACFCSSEARLEIQHYLIRAEACVKTN